MKVKICGITTVEDGLAAADAGADALGFMFYEPSVRFVTADQASPILAALPPFVTKVGVFVNPTETFVRQTLEQCPLDALQFHGEESPAFCRQFRGKVIKAFRVKDHDSLLATREFPAETWLLDSHVPGQRGGTGARFNWEIARAAVRGGGRVILAGGLTPENVAEAARIVRPYGFDVSSGVESSPGRKDAAKLKDFVAAVRAMES